MPGVQNVCLIHKNIPFYRLESWNGSHY
ncbi:hypothetical protein ID866_12723 [Astraeus odoratus]|nr:hypothetical protein ID866_12723 [Astraeus odoratus]